MFYLFHILFFHIIKLSEEKIRKFDLNLHDKLNIKNMTFNDSISLKIMIKDLKPFSSYSLQIHRIGSLGISLETKFICNDIIGMKENDNNNIRLTDVSRRTFETNKHKFPKICAQEYDEDYFIISLKPSSKVYQFIHENDIKFNIIIDIIENIGGYTFKSFFSTGLYKGLIINLFFIPLLIFIFKEKIKVSLIRALGIEVKNN